MRRALAQLLEADSCARTVLDVDSWGDMIRAAGDSDLREVRLTADKKLAVVLQITNDRRAPWATDHCSLAARAPIIPSRLTG